MNQPEPSRDLSSGFMAIGAAILLSIGCLVTALSGGWWWLLFGLLAVLDLTTFYGIGESFQKVPRDAKGNRLKADS
jgi:hypothetical protein